MSFNGANPTGARSATVEDLKTLKSPEEGGTKKNYEEFLETIAHHVTISWTFGTDMGYVIQNGEDPVIEEPKDLAKEEDTKWKLRLWEAKVDAYGRRVSLLEENKKAMYSLTLGNVSKITKAKIMSNVPR